MADKLRKFFETEVEKAAGSDNQLWFSSSTEHRDRHGDVVVADGWKFKDYMKNPVFMWAHDYSKPPIGKAIKTELSNNKLRNLMEFVPQHIDPFAEQIKQLYKGGFLNTVSVGFMTYKQEPLTDEDMKQRPDMKYGARLYGDLLEVSAVPVPANPMALQNGFMEAVAKGMARSGEQPRAGAKLSGLLEVARSLDDGDHDKLRTIRGLAALTLGARGGLLDNKERAVKEFNLLREEAARMGDHSMDNILFDIGITQDAAFLRSAFADVWDDKILNLQAQFRASEPEKKGMTDTDMEAVKSVLQSTAETLAAVKAALK